MGDRNYEIYVERMHARAEGLAEGKKEGKIEMARQATFSQSNQQQTFFIDELHLCHIFFRKTRFFAGNPHYNQNHRISHTSNTCRPTSLL